MTHWLEVLMRTPLTEAIGWVLFHFLWQGALIAVALLATLHFIRSSERRYIAACIAMAATVAAFAGTLFWQWPGVNTGRGTSIVTSAILIGESATDAGTSRMFQPSEMLHWAVPFWLAGVLFFQLRTVVRWMAARRLRTYGTCVAPAHWQGRLSDLSIRLRVSQPVALFESSLARVPSVIGHLRPAILIPAGLLASMPPDQIEAILLHELAHIRRNDYLVNLLQNVAEGLLFYHPAIWWMSGIIRVEREHCCDDAAIATGSGNAYEYAMALAALEQSRWGSSDITATAASGGSLVGRVRRLLHPEQTLAPQSGWALPVVMLGVMLAIAVTAAPAPQEPKAGPYIKWLNEDVAYIIKPVEREAFLQLKTDEERERFVVQFWLIRDPMPGTFENEYKEEHYRRIGYANSRFWSAIPGWKTDRGKIYILFGPADEIESHPSGQGEKPPFEHWLYKYLEGIGSRVIIEFVDAKRTGDFRMMTDPAAKK